MTPRERWEAVLSRQRPDRVPMNCRSTPEFTAKLIGHLGCGSQREMLAKLYVDYVVRVRPEYVGPQLPENTDVFGCHYRCVDYGSGEHLECVSQPLAEFSSVEEVRS